MRRFFDTVTDAMHSKPLFIADGHHRYETALNYQKLRRQQAGSQTGLQPYDSCSCCSPRLKIQD